MSKLTPMTDVQVNELAMKMVGNQIFCSDQIHKEQLQQMLPMVFLPLALGGEDLSQTLKENEIGVVYEEYSKAGPRSINGYPSFFSCNFVLLEDWKRVLAVYGKMRIALEAAKLPETENKEKEKP